MYMGEKTHQVCDAFPDIKVSLEFKPTDENTRFFIVPSTGAALLLVNEVRECVRRRHVSRPATAPAAREDRSLAPLDNDGVAVARASDDVPRARISLSPRTKPKA